MTTLYNALVQQGFTPQQARLTIISIRDWTQAHYPVLAAAANGDLRMPTLKLDELSPEKLNRPGSPAMDNPERSVA